jgi:hypothetical protein
LDLFFGDELRLLACFWTSAATDSTGVITTDFPVVEVDPGEADVGIFCDGTEFVFLDTEVCEGMSLSQTCVDISFIEDDFTTVAYDGRYGLGTLYIFTSFLASW